MLITLLYRYNEIGTATWRIADAIGGVAEFIAPYALPTITDMIGISAMDTNGGTQFTVNGNNFVIIIIITIFTILIIIVIFIIRSFVYCNVQHTGAIRFSDACELW